jgi:hypothetical protein
MIVIHARPDAVKPAEGIVHQIQERRDRRRKEGAFPPVPAEKEEEPPADDDSDGSKTTDEDGEHQIDIHVLGRRVTPPAIAAMSG